MRTSDDRKTFILIIFGLATSRSMSNSKTALIGSIQWIKKDENDDQVSLYGLKAAAAHHPCVIVNIASPSNRMVTIYVVRAPQLQHDKPLTCVSSGDFTERTSHRRSKTKNERSAALSPHISNADQYIRWFVPASSRKRC